MVPSHHGDRRAPMILGVIDRHLELHKVDWKDWDE